MQLHSLLPELILHKYSVEGYCSSPFLFILPFLSATPLQFFTSAFSNHLLVRPEAPSADHGLPLPQQTSSSLRVAVFSEQVRNTQEVILLATWGSDGECLLLLLEASFFLWFWHEEDAGAKLSRLRIRHIFGLFSEQITDKELCLFLREWFFPLVWSPAACASRYHYHNIVTGCSNAFVLDNRGRFFFFFFILKTFRERRCSCLFAVPMNSAWQPKRDPCSALASRDTSGVYGKGDRLQTATCTRTHSRVDRCQHWTRWVDKPPIAPRKAGTGVRVARIPGDTGDCFC